MQASLNDMALTRRNTPSFFMCQRVLDKCHQIIFGDIPSPVSAPYSSLAVPSRSRFLRKKVKTRFEPAIVGMGCVLASVPGMPQVAELTGRVAVEQGRWEDATARRLPANAETGEDAAPGAQHSKEAIIADEESEEDEREEDEEQIDLRTHNGAAAGGVVSPSKSSSSIMRSTGSRTRKQRVRAAQTTPALPLQSALVSKPSRLSDDPLGQFDGPLPPSSRYMSSPIVSNAHHHQVRSSSMSVDFLLKRYDIYSQAQLLRSYYLRGEVSSANLLAGIQLERPIYEIQFLLGLETIANRLLVVPRPARVSALRAELTNLNHKLPAEVNPDPYIPYELFSTD